jgi:hypothetical protein
MEEEIESRDFVAAFFIFPPVMLNLFQHLTDRQDAMQKRLIDGIPKQVRNDVWGVFN